MTLEISVVEQLWCVLASFIFGIFAGVLYDVFTVFSMSSGIGAYRSARAARFVSRTLIFLSDMVYCMVVAISYAVLTYIFSYGRVRLWFVICSVLGFAVYRITFSRPLLYVSECVVKAVGRLFRLLARVILIPIKLILRAVRCTLYVAYSATAGRLVARLDSKLKMRRVRRIIKNYISYSVRL